jgi:hypothetical protein
MVVIGGMMGVETGASGAMFFTSILPRIRNNSLDFHL